MSPSTTRSSIGPSGPRHQPRPVAPAVRRRRAVPGLAVAPAPAAGRPYHGPASRQPDGSTPPLTDVRSLGPAALSPRRRRRLTRRGSGRGGRGPRPALPGPPARHQHPAPAEGDTPMDELEIFNFDPWPDPAIDPYNQDPNGHWSRLGWLPTIGPSSWLVWGTLAAQLARDPQVSWPVRMLGSAHGLHGSTARNGPIRRSIARLCQFRLLASSGGERDPGPVYPPPPAPPRPHPP